MYIKDRARLSDRNYRHCALLWPTEVVRSTKVIRPHKNNKAIIKVMGLQDEEIKKTKRVALYGSVYKYSKFGKHMMCVVINSVYIAHTLRW